MQDEADDTKIDGSDDAPEKKEPPNPKKTKKKKERKSVSKKSKRKSSEIKKKKRTRKSELKEESRHRLSLERAVKRISNPCMENPAEIVFISGESGVGKSHWIESETNTILQKIQNDEIDNDYREADDDSDDDHSNYFPIICKGACEVPLRIRSDDNDNDVMESKSLITSRPPMHAITEALNNLIRSLTRSGMSRDGRDNSNASNVSHFYGGKVIWKRRIGEALGITEASYLASTGLVPELGVLLDLPDSFNARKTTQLFDWNTVYQFHRSCLAIRDLLRAISEAHHPVIMVLNNLHEADEDTYRLLNFLLTGCHWKIQHEAETGIDSVDKHPDFASAEETTDIITANTASIKNFLLIGLHESDQNDQDHMLESLERSFCQRQMTSLRESQELLTDESERDHEGNPQTSIHSNLTKINLTQFSRKKVEEVLRYHVLKSNENGIKEEYETSDLVENLEELVELIYEWTDGNIFYILQVCEYLKEERIITFSPSCKWSINKIRSEMNRWNGSVIGVAATRIDRLPKAVRFLLISISALRQTFIEFSARDLYTLLKAAYADTGRGKKKKGELEFPFESSSQLENTLELASDLGFVKNVLYRRNSDDNYPHWAFAHTIIRDEAYSLFTKKKKKNQMEIHLRLGTKASALAFVPKFSDQPTYEKNGENSQSNIEYAAFKFIAADQLAIAQEIITQDINKVALLFVETAELCVSKSAICAAIKYLLDGIKILESGEESFTAESHGIRIRAYILLARLNSIYDRGTSETDKILHKIFNNSKNLKDQVLLHQAEIEILIWQKKYQDALQKVLSALELLGERTPNTLELPEMISFQSEKLIEQTRWKDNQILLKPPYCTDKKTFDVLILLSNLIEISRLEKKSGFEELATIRMMNRCLFSGFTPQYSISFAHYGSMLMERAFATNDYDLLRVGYRMGQICEKMASVKSFCGGHSLAIFHSNISHWRRPYRRSLGQILSIYNAQLESGDYFHIQFTTFIYIQYHLTSGHNLAKLDDNLQLFDVLYQDYKMEDRWKIQLPQRFVENLLGETSDPFIFYGTTIEDQNLRIRQLEEDGENDAIQLLYFLILFNAIFFHNHELAKSCLENIVEEEVISIWKPWVIFFQCITDIFSLPYIQKKADKKQMKEYILEQRDRLLDWYNEGAVNCSVLVSLIDAEYTVTETGKKAMPTLRIKKFYDDAIAVAQEQELKHMEAFCLERASMRFEAADAEGLSAEYIAKAHQCYFEWNAIAKVDDVEENNELKLKLAKQEKKVGSGYVQRNRDMHYDQKPIGGGRKKIKSINMKGMAKTAGKVKKIVIGKSNRKKPKSVSEREKSSRAPPRQNKRISITSFMK